MKRKIEDFLNLLIENAKIQKLNEYEEDNLIQKLNDNFIIDQSYLEFIIKDKFINLFSKEWKLSKRSPLIFQEVKKKNEELYLGFKSNFEGGGKKYLYPNNQIAFIENGGFYIGIGEIYSSGYINIYEQRIYLKNDIFKKKFSTKNKENKFHFKF